MPAGQVENGQDDLVVGVSTRGAGSVHVPEGPMTIDRLLTDTSGVLTLRPGDVGVHLSAGADLDGDGRPDLPFGSEKDDTEATDAGVLWRFNAGGA